MGIEHKPHSGRLSDTDYYALVNAVTSRFDCDRVGRGIVDRDGMRAEFDCVLGGLFEQLEAQEKMLRAYVERFGLILPTDEPRATVTYPAKGYELHTRTGATPTFAEDDVDSPAISQSECDGTRYCVAETHIHGCFAERAPASRWPGATAFYRSVPNQESKP